MKLSLSVPGREEEAGEREVDVLPGRGLVSLKPQ